MESFVQLRRGHNAGTNPADVGELKDDEMGRKRLHDGGSAVLYRRKDPTAFRARWP